jgi:hypothetical protein
MENDLELDRPYTQFLKIHAMTGAALLLLGALSHQLKLFSVDLIALGGGILLSLANVWTFSVLGRLILRGSRRVLPILFVLAGKILLFFILILFLTQFETAVLYSGVAGFLSFIPAAIVYGKEQN